MARAARCARRPWIYTPGSISFRRPDGEPLDLHQSYRPDDDPEALRAFLEEAGFLHIEGVFDEDEMNDLQRDIDRHAYAYAPDDGQSWWAKTADGADRLVRLHAFDQHSDVAAALLEDDRFLRIGEITGDGHAVRAACQALTEADRRRVGHLRRAVAQGLQTRPPQLRLLRHDRRYLRDGRGRDIRPATGDRRVAPRPGVARVLAKGMDLPEIDLPTDTGDVTVHLSCTTHMSQPPVDRERRVIYTGFAFRRRTPRPCSSAQAAVPDHGVHPRRCLATTGPSGRRNITMKADSFRYDGKRVRGRRRTRPASGAATAELVAGPLRRRGRGHGPRAPVTPARREGHSR